MKKFGTELFCFDFDSNLHCLNVQDDDSIETIINDAEYKGSGLVDDLFGKSKKELMLECFAIAEYGNDQENCMSLEWYFEQGLFLAHELDYKLEESDRQRIIRNIKWDAKLFGLVLNKDIENWA